MTKGVRNLFWSTLKKVPGTFFVAALLGLAGCAGKPSGTADLEPDRRDAGQDIDHISDAFDVIQRLDEFEQQHALPMAMSHLDLWLALQQAPTGWKPDPLVDKITNRRHKEYPPLVHLGQMKFDDADFNYLREAVWLSDVARWVGDKPAATGSAKDWPQEMTANLAPENLRHLEVANRLFDWVVRNIQLDPLLPYPKEEKIGPQASPREAAQRPLARPGPGYQRFPWQTLLLGHGDALERARLFMLLLRAEGIDAVQLSLDVDDASARLRPWCVGVLVGEQLYLFDTALGLPIPRGDGRGIATLGEIKAHPEWLRTLDLSEEKKYPVAPGELDSVVALIDAAPAALSLRMNLLQAKLKGRNHLPVAVDASALAERIRKTPGLNDVRLSSLPFETQMYRERLETESMERIPREEFFFREITPVLKARLAHLRGELDRNEERRGAKGIYLTARIPDDLIERLPTSAEVQKQLGVYIPPPDDSIPSEKERAAYEARRQAMLFGFQESLRTARRNSSYWMGLAHWENGDYDLAVEWLGKQTLFAVPDGPWVNGSRYNLARAYEALGRNDKARQYYLDGDSPQKPGDTIRARRLEASAK